MAIIQNPIVGRAKQKFANSIFSTWYGRNVLRSKPLEVRNPRSGKQLTARYELSIRTAILALSLEMFKRIWKRKATSLPIYNEIARYLGTVRFLAYDRANNMILMTPVSEIIQNSGEDRLNFANIAYDGMQSAFRVRIIASQKGGRTAGTCYVYIANASADNANLDFRPEVIAIPVAPVTASSLYTWEILLDSAMINSLEQVYIVAVPTFVEDSMQKAYDIVVGADGF